MHYIGYFRFIESIHQIHIMQRLRNIAAQMSGEKKRFWEQNNLFGEGYKVHYVRHDCDPA